MTAARVRPNASQAVRASHTLVCPTYSSSTTNQGLCCTPSVARTMTSISSRQTPKFIGQQQPCFKEKWWFLGVVIQAISVRFKMDRHGTQLTFFFKISVVDDCQLKNIGSLSFDLVYGSAVNINDEFVLLCFSTVGTTVSGTTASNGGFTVTKHKSCVK